jgi:hypothetical protein
MLMFMPFCSYAENNYGVCHYKGRNMANINCYGTAQISESNVRGETNVAGTLQAIESNLTDVKVTGAAKLINSVVKGTLNVAGPLSATRSRLNGQIFVAADKIVLDATKVDGPVTIQSKINKPYLDLTCASVIRKSVIFEGAPGVVRKSAGSQVLGKIVNGTIINLDSNAKCERV